MSSRDVWAYYHDMAQRRFGRRVITEDELLDAVPSLCPHGGVVHCNAALYWAVRVHRVFKLYSKIHGVKVS